MAQNTVDFSADPSGTQLLDNLLTDLKANYDSMHSGTSRPSYAVAGLLWLDTTTTPLALTLFDGTDDIVLGYLDATANTFVLNPNFTQTFAGIRIPNAGILGPSGSSGTYALSAWDSVGTAFRNMLTITSGAAQSIALAPSAAAVEPWIVPHGTAPTTPTNGSIWSTTAGLFARINGATTQFADATAWSTSSPTPTALSGTFTSVSATVRYKQIGKTVFFNCVVTVTTNGTAAGDVRVPLPITAYSSSAMAGRNTATGTGLTGDIGSFGLDTLQIKTYNNLYPAADGSVLRVTGCYEAA